MALEQVKIHDIVKQAVSKNVDIPEFQREFVWAPDQVKLLAESLFRHYPVGSFLLWDSRGYEEAKTAQGAHASLWIVDGQQRTTAICLLLGEKPYWWPDFKKWNDALQRYDVMVNLMPENGDARLEFALPNPIRRQDPRWVSIRRVVSVKAVEELTPLAQEIVQRNVGDSPGAMSQFGKVHARLHALWQIRERDIPIIKIDHEVEDVAEIFARLNQAGTRVKEADVILALAAVRNPGWVREDYLPFRDHLEERGWDLDAGIFIRTMTGIGYGRARLIDVPKDFWNHQKLPPVWGHCRDTIAEVLRRLAEFGIVSADLLPSTNSLIPLFVLHHRWRRSPGYRFGKALRWFLLANQDGRYSGSAITSLNEDVRAINDAPSFDDAVESLSRRLRASPTIPADEFLGRYDRAGASRFLRLMLYLCIFQQQARDLVDDTRIGYDKAGDVVLAGFEPQWHHIFPRSLLKQTGVGDDDIQALANITVLNERTNVAKCGTKAPSVYLREFRVTSDALRRHAIPESYASVVADDVRLGERWSVEKYTDFVIERAQVLAREATGLLERLGAS